MSRVGTLREPPRPSARRLSLDLQQPSTGSKKRSAAQQHFSDFASINSVARPDGAWRIQSWLEEDHFHRHSKPVPYKSVRVGLFDLEAMREQENLHDVDNSGRNRRRRVEVEPVTDLIRCSDVIDSFSATRVPPLRSSCTSPLAQREFQQAKGIADMPDEILVRIFSFLRFRSLVVCAKVNRQFYRISRDNFPSISLPQSFRPELGAFVLQRNPRGLHISNSNVSLASVLNLVDLSKISLSLMQSLELHNSEMSGFLFKFIAAHSGEGQSPCLPSLRCLDLSFCDFTQMNVDYDAFFASMPNLVHLNVARASFAPALLPSLVRHCRSLRTLDLSWARGVRSLEPLFARNETLRALNVSGLNHITDEQFAECVEKLDKLVYLSLNDTILPGKVTLTALRSSKLLVLDALRTFIHHPEDFGYMMRCRSDMLAYRFRETVWVVNSDAIKVLSKVGVPALLGGDVERNSAKGCGTICYCKRRPQQLPLPAPHVTKEKTDIMFKAHCTCVGQCACNFVAQLFNAL